MVLSALTRRLGRLGLAAKLAVRSFTRIDTNPVPREWTHITKVDPEDEKQLPLLYPLYLQHTSAISVGGSRDVNSTNTEETFELLAVVDVPVFHEPSAARHVTERTRKHSEFLAIPEVLNGDSSAIVGTLGEGTAYLRSEMVPALLADRVGWLPAGWLTKLADFVTSWLLESAVFEAYIIQNVDSAAAREANVTEADLLTPAAAAHRALAAEKHLESQVIYLEYSGTYGGDEATAILSALRDEISWSRIWYGGGIASREDATAVLEAGADTVIVGNAFHEIAVEEVELVEQAQESLSTAASPTAIRDWLTAAIEPTDTEVFGYLSTIPDLAEPEEATERYLVKSIQLHFALARASTAGGEEIGDRLVSEWTDIDPRTLPDAYWDLIAAAVATGDGRREPETRSLLSHLSGLEPHLQ